MDQAPDARWSPDGHLPISLMLAAAATLSVDDNAQSVPAGAPFRVLQSEGTVVRIEVRLPEGSVVSGFTTRDRTTVRQHRRRWFR